MYIQNCKDEYSSKTKMKYTVTEQLCVSEDIFA